MLTKKFYIYHTNSPLAQFLVPVEPVLKKFLLPVCINSICQHAPLSNRHVVTWRTLYTDR